MRDESMITHKIFYCGCDAYATSFRNNEVWYKLSGQNKHCPDHKVGEFERCFEDRPVILKLIQQYINSKKCNIHHFIKEHKFDEPVKVGSKKDIKLKKASRLRKLKLELMEKNKIANHEKNVTVEKIVTSFYKQYLIYYLKGSNFVYRRKNSKTNHYGREELYNTLQTKFKVSKEKINKSIDVILK
jgi:hypothetical protein